MQGYMTESCVFQRLMNAVAAGTSTQSSSRVDLQTQNADAVCFALTFGDVLDTCAIVVRVMENTPDGTSGATAIPGASYTATAGATDHDNKIVLIDVKRSKITKRYVYLEVARATANAIIDGVTAIIYEKSALPVTQDSSVVNTTQAGS